jgi:hypothetical protein
MLKLRALVIANEIYCWIEDWLKDRKQRVLVLGSNSEWIGIKKWGATGFKFWTIIISSVHK